jgi:hypothetical protein
MIDKELLIDTFASVYIYIFRILCARQWTLQVFGGGFSMCHILFLMYIIT